MSSRGKLTFSGSPAVGLGGLELRWGSDYGYGPNPSPTQDAPLRVYESSDSGSL
jgi:hypothetical protein